MKKILALLLELVMLIGMLPQILLIATAEEVVSAKNELTGKTISILGASISTYGGISNGTAAETTNSTIGNNAQYYPHTTVNDVTLNDTWWMQVCNDLGLRLLVNNSWSGSSLLHTRNGTVGAYVDRCVQLHDDTGDNASEEPDIIGIQLGTNDFQYYKDTLGTADIDYDAMITQNEDGSYTYATPVTSLEATAIVLHKISVRYPDAEVYYLNISQRVDDTDELIQSFNAELKQVVEHFGYHIVDIYDSAITMDDFETYIGDGRVHPNKLGMDAYTEAFKRALLENTACEVDTHTVSINLDGVNANYGDDKIVVSGDSYTVSLAAAAEMCLNVNVTMGGKDVTAAVYANGTVTIDCVTNDVTITAKSTYDPKDYRWEFEGTDLICVSGDNALTKNAGTTTDGVFSKTCYVMESNVVLLHDLPWAVEWKCEGTFQNTGSSSGARVFTSTNVNVEYNARYIFKSNTNGIVAMGEKTSSGSHNYGIALGDYGIDWTVLHTYRLENHISDAGSNMIYLFVDGVEIGPMNHYYIGTKDQDTTSDWLSGKDFVFPYMGTDTHGFTNASIEYIQVTECVHAYGNGICTTCGAEHPNMAKLDGKVISVLGDSISTFAGYIPVADGFNLEHLARYPQDNLLTDVNETWWMQVILSLNAQLGINDSWRGATVSGAAPVTTGTTGENAAMGNLQRIKNLGANGTPDVILFYGGTNDLAHVSKIGTFDAANAPSTVDLTTTKWDNLADGYVHTLLRLQHFYPDAQIIAMLPTYTNGYYSNEKLAAGNAVLTAICEHYGVIYLDLRECGISTADLPDNIHPDATGMDYISAAVIDALLNACELAVGKNVVYSVTHKLTNAESSMGYYKGVSHGKPFVTAITGEDVTISVTMGGVDITSECYTNGTVSILEVTGDIVLTAEGTARPIYEDHLQQLPARICSGTNLWTVLAHDKQYYTVNGWGIHSSGTVCSVTFPVSTGDRIYASSFGAAGTNGSSMNGIRVTWFDKNGVLKSVSADKVYTEFSANGYLIVPEGAVVVNIPMWTVSDDNIIHILNRDHCYENGVCLGCDDKQRPVVGWSLTLGEDIGMNFMVSVAESFTNQTSVRITVADGDAVTYKVSDHTPDEDGNYLFRINIASAQMTADVKLQVFVGDEAGEIYTYTVEQYAKAILNNENFSSYHTLVKEMLSYGAAAQTYFNYNTDKPIDSALYTGAGAKEIEETLPQITNSGNIDGLIFYGATLLHQSKTALRFYFKGADMSQCTINANEKVLKPVQRNGLWYVEIRDILPQSLNEPVTVSVVCGDDSITVSYSPMHYIVRMSNKGSDTLQALMKAMYNYHLAAKAMAESAKNPMAFSHRIFCRQSTVPARDLLYYTAL